MEPAHREGECVLESFLVHSRNLASFFGNPPEDRSDRDDVYAVDYQRAWRGTGADLKKLTDAARHINKRVQHITAYRQRVTAADDEAERSDMRRMRDGARATWNKWYELLPAERKSWFTPWQGEVPT